MKSITLYKIIMSSLLGTMIVSSAPVEAYNHYDFSIGIDAEDIGVAVAGVGIVCAGIYGLYKAIQWAEDYHIRSFCADFRSEVEYLVRHTDQFAITRTCCLRNNKVEVSVTCDLGDCFVEITADNHVHGRESYARKVEIFPSEWMREVITKLVTRW